MRGARISIVLKLMLFVGTLLSSVVAFFTYGEYTRSKSEIEEKFGLALKHVAITGALSLDGAEHLKIRNAKDEKSEAFRILRSRVHAIMQANSLTPETTYTFRIGDDHRLFFAVMLQQKTFIGTEYKIPDYNKALFMRVFQGEAVHTPVYKDDHGTWISGLAPITLNGRTIGIFEVDYGVEKFFMAVEARTKTTLVYAGLALLASLLAMLFIALKIAKPIKDLRGAALKIIEGDYTVKVSIDTRDEIGELEKVFNRMVKSLSERFLMLKYISPHTQRMIEKQIHNEVEAEGELKNVTIFFSDVRGFTKYSEGRNPREVIAVLNDILEKQADIIARHGGEIDKFVGDEIVAVFDGPDQQRAAINAALEIRALVLSGGTLLSVGIGIATGEVIFGNIGSPDRRDFTIIGSNVNLTARICAAAEPGQILIASHLLYKLGEDQRGVGNLVVTPKEAISLKGFSQPVPLFCVQRSG